MPTEFPTGIAYGYEKDTDWCELCTYLNQQHVEYELTAIQWTVCERLLGLNLDEPHDDEFLSTKLLPAILKALKQTTN